MRDFAADRKLIEDVRLLYRHDANQFSRLLTATGWLAALDRIDELEKLVGDLIETGTAAVCRCCDPGDKATWFFAVDEAKTALKPDEPK